MKTKINKRHVDNYLYFKKDIKEICKEVNISRKKFNNDLKRLGFKTRYSYYKDLDFKNKKLLNKLKVKYRGLTKRCRGVNYDGNYCEGLEYLRLDEWVEFCNQNKDKLQKIWNNYIENNKDRRLTVSIDRINENEGYIPYNMRFVTNGYNVWRRNIRPVKVKFKDEWHYFMSAEEGSRFFDVRRQSIGDLLRGDYRKISKNYTVKESSIKEVLSNSVVDNTENYYEKYIYSQGA